MGKNKKTGTPAGNLIGSLDTGIYIAPACVNTVKEEQTLRNTSAAYGNRPNATTVTTLLESKIASLSLINVVVGRNY